MASPDEKWTPAQADRHPTEDEERAAELAAAGVDLDRVARHATEMAKFGANAQGSGQIAPNRENSDCDV